MTKHGIILIIVMAVVTAIIRFAPFAIFRDENKMPQSLIYLGGVLPGAIMGMLVIYCFKSTSISAAPHGIPEFIATIVIALTYLWKRNVLISITIGTVFYMALIQLVF